MSERKGQALFNAAYALFPIQVGKVQISAILGERTDVDPYYVDDNSARFIAALAEELQE